MSFFAFLPEIATGDHDPRSPRAVVHGGTHARGISPVRCCSSSHLNPKFEFQTLLLCAPSHKEGS